MKFTTLFWLLWLLGSVASANSPPNAASDTFIFKEDAIDTFTFCSQAGVCTDLDNDLSELSVVITELPVGFGVFQDIRNSTPVNITNALLPYTLSPASKRIKHVPPPHWVTDQTFTSSYQLYDGVAYSIDNPTVTFNFTVANDVPIAFNKTVETRDTITEVIALDCYDEERSIAELNITNAPLSYTGVLYQFINATDRLGDMILSRQRVTDPNYRVWYVPVAGSTSRSVNFTFNCRDTSNAISNDATVIIKYTNPAPPPSTLTTTTTLTVATTVTAPTTTTVATTVTASSIIPVTTMLSGTTVFSLTNMHSGVSMFDGATVTVASTMTVEATLTIATALTTATTTTTTATEAATTTTTTTAISTTTEATTVTTTKIAPISSETPKPPPPPNGAPKIACRDTIELSSDFLIGNDPSYKIQLAAFDEDPIRFKLIQTPEYGVLLAMSNVTLRNGDEFSENTLLYTNNNGGGFSSVNFSYVAIDNGNLSSELCTTVLLAWCPFPRVTNIFDRKKGSICVDCPEGAQCSFDGRYLPFANKGYWQSSDVFLPCIPESACTGEATQTCAPQYEGIRCGKCVAGYYRLGHECIPCSSNLTATILILAAILVGLMIVLYVFLKVVQSGPGLGLASILVNFLQTILVIRDLQLKWTLTFHSVLNVLSVINFNVDLVSPECFITTESFRFSLKMKLVLLIPIILVSILALVVGLHSPQLAYILSKLKRMFTLIKGNSRNRTGVVSRQIIAPAEAQRNIMFVAIRAFNVFLSVLYIMVATQSLALFDCTKEADNHLYLDADVSLRCYENWWWEDLPLAVGAVIVYVIGIPVYYFCLFYILYQNKHRSPRWQRWKKIVQKIQDTEYAFLKPEYQYFVFLQIIFKLAIIAVRMFFTSYITLQIALTLAILLGSFILYWSRKPYAYNMLNFLEVQSTIHSMIILMLGLLFYNEQFKTEQQKTMITIITLFFVFSFILSVVCCGLYGMRGSFNRFKASIGKNAKREGGEEKIATAKVHGFPVRSADVRCREMKSSNALGGTRSQMLIGSSSNLLQ